jgi:hypothetical protein
MENLSLFAMEGERKLGREFFSKQPGEIILWKKWISEVVHGLHRDFIGW